MTPNEEAIDIRGVAKMLNIGVDNAYRKAKAKEIPGFKIGRNWRFFPSEVHEALSKPADEWAYLKGSRLGRRRSA